MDLDDVVSTSVTVVKVVLAVVLVLGLLVGILVATGVLQSPTVEGIEKAWGPVTNETTTIEATALVDNPNPVGVPGVITVKFTAKMNDVVLTKGKRSGVGLSTGNNSIELESQIPNDRIATWWKGHVNRGESSTLTIDPVVTGPLFRRSLANRTSKIETDLLAPLRTSQPRRLGFGNRDFLVVENQSAQWGTATNETTPLQVSARIRNVHDYDVTLAGVEYVVTMNGVTLGNGSTSEDFAVEPGQTETLTVDAALDTQQFATWWPTHVRNNETSRMHVRMYGLIERNGTMRRVPLTLYEQRLAFETDVLQGGATVVRALETPSEEPISIPQLKSTTQKWGEVSEATTEIVSTARFSTPESFAKIRDLVRIESQRQVTINGIEVANATTTIQQLPDDGTVTTTTDLANDRVPAWWARHLNNGETSTMSLSSSAVADVGLTKVALNATEESKTIETDLLSEFESTETTPVTLDGETVLYAEGTSAQWGEATPDRAPLSVTTTMRNERRIPVDIEQINYEVSINGITLADDVVRETYTIQPGESQAIGLSMVLDNSKMDRWWVTHLRNGERSTLSVNATATVTIGDRTGTVQLESLSGNSTITTAFLE